MKKLLIAGVFGLGLVLGGCATTPIQQAERKQLSDERHIAYKEQTEVNNSKITVTRDHGFTGGGCYYGFWIDGVLAARFDTKESADFYIPSGERVLRAGRDPMGRGLCAVDQKNWTQTETTVSPDQVKSYRLSLDVNGRPAVHRDN